MSPPGRNAAARPRLSSGKTLQRWRQTRIRAAIAEVMEAVFGDVAKITLGVDDFVIAVQRVQRAACSFGLAAQPLEQVEDLRLVITAIQLIPRLDDDQRAADPLSRTVDGARQAERVTRGVNITVDVTDGDDARGARKSKRGIVDREGRTRRGVGRPRGGR